MNNLEKRIREVASKMEGKFMGTVPHSVFVEWDSTWDIAEEIDPEWGSPCNENSTDEEIEDCILYREGCCDECYKDGVEAYGLVEAMRKDPLIVQAAKYEATPMDWRKLEFDPDITKSVGRKMLSL